VTSRALLFAIAALAAGAASAATPAPPGSVRWLAPADGAVWVAGGRAELAWEPVGPAAALAGADEWEAFLSADGGRTWSVRLTPHLDLGRRRVFVEVPDLPSPDVRLLLRVGDERDERELAVPLRLRVVRPTGPRAARLDAPGLALRRGESAREGGGGVVLWAAGGRDARAPRWYAFSGAAAALARGGWSPPFSLLGGGPPEPGPSLAAAVARRARPPAGGSAPGAHRAAGPRPSGPAIDPLLAGCRRNT
jgi:hypothetical protein